MTSRILAFGISLLLISSLAFAQTKTGLVAKITMPAEINLGVANPDKKIIPVRVTASFADGKKYNGMLDINASFGFFVDDKGNNLPTFSRIRLKFTDGFASARLKPNYNGGPLKITASLGSMADTEVVGRAESFVRVPESSAIVEEKTRRVVLANGIDHPIVTVYVIDQTGKPLANCETSAKCSPTDSKVTALTDAKGFARLTIPACKQNMLASCAINVGANCLTYVTVLYADKQDGSIYKSADVKLAEKMIADKFYDSAIGLLSNFDGIFHSGPSGKYVAARARILLCKAYAAKGDTESEAYKIVRKHLEENLAGIWSGLSVQEPDVRKRLQRMNYIFDGQSQAFADFTKPLLNKIAPHSQDLSVPIAFLDYYQKLGVSDMELIRQIGNMALDAKINSTTQPQIASLVQRVYCIYPACFSNSDEQMAKSLIIRKDYSGAELMIKAVFKARPNELSSNSLIGYIRMWLLGLNDKKDIIRMARATLTGDVDEGLRWAETDDIADQLFALKRYAEAIAEYTKAADIERKRGWQASALYQMALCYKELGNTSEAARVFTEVANTNPDTNPARDAIKQLYLLGTYEEKPAKPIEAAGAK